MKEDEKEILMTEEETFDVLEFAQQMMNSSSMYGLGVFTPDIVNSALKQINVNTLEPTEGNLNRALGRPNENEDNLVGYSEWYNINNMMYKRTNNYLGNMLAFDLKITSNAKGADFHSDKYKRDLEEVYKFLDKLNYKREFKKIVNNMLRQETIFTSFRDDAANYAIQQLPSKYCKITGNTGFTMLFDFDMYYFLTPGVSIDNYYPIFKEYYYDVFHESGIDNYYPSNPLNKRNGEFAMWHQTSPLDNFWCWKFAPEIFTKIPYLAPMMKDSQQANKMRELQMNKNIASARALILGEIGFLDNVKSGAKVDQVRLKPSTLATFMKLIKAGLEDVWQVGGVPLEGNKKFQFEDRNPDMYQKYLNTTSSQSVSMSRAIFANDKMSQAEALIALQTDGNLMRALYQQFNDFLNFYVNKRTRSFTFYFEFEGLDYDEDREARLSRSLDLADRGIVLPQMITAACGIKPQEFSRMMEEGQYSGFSEKLTQLLSIHTASSGEKTGRPRKSRVSTESRDYDE